MFITHQLNGSGAWNFSAWVQHYFANNCLGIMSLLQTRHSVDYSEEKPPQIPTKACRQVCQRSNVVYIKRFQSAVLLIIHAPRNCTSNSQAFELERNQVSSKKQNIHQLVATMGSIMSSVLWLTALTAKVTEQLYFFETVPSAQMVHAKSATCIRGDNFSSMRHPRT